MARHVGRPTNEEVAARKRKQMLKILIPGGLVALAVIMIIGSTGLRGLMGASVSYCNPGDGNPDSDNMCTSKMDARLLGDVNGDSQITQADADLIKIGNFESASIDFAAADVNKDGKVSIDDATVIENFLNGANTTTIDTEGNIDYTTGSGATTPESVLAWNEEYVCPVDYLVDGATCIKKYDALSKEVADENKDNQTSDTNNNDNKNCYFDTTYNVYLCKSTEPQNIDVDEFESDLNLDEDIDLDNDTSLTDEETDNNLETKEEDVSIIKQSNYLNYGTDSNNNPAVGKYGTLYVKTKDANSGLDIMSNLSSQVDDYIIYQVYSSEDGCKNQTSSSVVDGKGDVFYGYDSQGYATQIVNKSTTIVQGQTKNSIAINIYKGTNFAYDDDEVKLYVKQLRTAQGYQQSSECKQFTLKKNGEASVTFYNKPTDATGGYWNYIKMDNTVVSKGNVLLKDNNNIFKTNNKIIKFFKGTPTKIMNGLSVKNYSFKGWIVQRKSDSKYLCYADNTLNSNNTSWNKTCTYGKVIIGKKGTANNINNYIVKNGDTLIFKAVWERTVNTKLTLTLKNSESNQLYARTAIVKLYKQKTDCEKNVNPLVSKKITKSNKGKLILYRKWNSSLDYYVKITANSSYYDSRKNSCKKVSLTPTLSDSFMTLKLIPKAYNVEYYGGSKTIGNIKSSTVYMDSTYSIKNVKSNSSKFSYWKAHNISDNTYRCYNANGKKGWFKKSQCKKYIKYNSNNKVSKITNLVAPGKKVRMEAVWK